MLSTLTLLQIINSTDSGIIILDSDRHIQTWNTWLTKYTELDQDDVENKTLNEIFGEEISKHFYSSIDLALEQGRSTFISPRLHKHPLPLYRDAIKDENK